MADPTSTLHRHYADAFPPTIPATPTLLLPGARVLHRSHELPGRVLEVNGRKAAVGVSGGGLHHVFHAVPLSSLLLDLSDRTTRAQVAWFVKARTRLLPMSAAIPHPLRHISAGNVLHYAMQGHDMSADHVGVLAAWVVWVQEVLGAE